jgi:hypothetical protein
LFLARALLFLRVDLWGELASAESRGADAGARSGLVGSSVERGKPSLARRDIDVSRESVLASSPTNLRPSFAAETSVVPLPAYGSSTTSPGLERAWTSLSSSAKGFCDG